MSEGPGRYLVREQVLKKMRGKKLRFPKATDLAIVEIPQTEDFTYIEVRNRSSDALRLDGNIVIRSGDAVLENGSVEEGCVIDAGETLVFRTASTDGSPPGKSCVVRQSVSGLQRGPVELRLPNGDVLARARVRWATGETEDFDPDRPLRAWQVDQAGKACFAPASLGTENARCR